MKSMLVHYLYIINRNIIELVPHIKKRNYFTFIYVYVLQLDIFLFWLPRDHQGRYEHRKIEFLNK